MRAGFGRVTSGCPGGIIRVATGEALRFVGSLRYAPSRTEVRILVPKIKWPEPRYAEARAI
ncbi:MAG: hypothetical protein CMO55_14880 [Verrucomicrobiales bacterium]|nr:hypothetical protein [Verrucomicrobiales bacterium]